MKSIALLFLVSISNTFYPVSTYNVLVYDLIVSGNTIGTVTATKKVEGDKITYTSNSNATVTMLFKIEIKTRMTVVYKNNILQESSYKFYKNGNLKEEATTILTNGKYTITHNKKVSTYSKGILKSTIVLPFDKPKNNESYFEEVQGYFKTMKLINGNKYQLFDQNNSQKDDYNYKDDYLESSIVRNAIVDFKMVLKTK
jgi:hypothetical protein